jgi:predicted nucleic acid-binding protein
MADARRVEAVADTSFLIALQWLELLETLGQVHTRVLVPERVWDEFAEGASEAELAAVARIGVIQRTQVSNATLAAAIGTAAEGGEAEVIALALESGIILVLMDDYRGRKVAQRLGLKTRGILGHLLLLKRLGSIEAVRGYLEKLKERGFFLSEQIIREVLSLAGEE